MNCLDIISRAMRRLGIIASGELPQNQEADDALETLKGIYRRLITEGAFGSLTEVFATVDMTARENSRITADLSSNITLPDRISDGCGGTRPPRDGAIICVVDPTTNQVDEYIFDGATKTWVTIDDLDLTAAAPLSHRDPVGLSCYLAVELADEYGQTPSQITTLNAARFHMGITHNWSVEEAPAKGIFF